MWWLIVGGLMGCTHLRAYQHGDETIAVTAEQASLYERQRKVATALLSETSDRAQCKAMAEIVDSTPSGPPVDLSMATGATDLPLRDANQLLMVDEVNVCRRYDVALRERAGRLVAESEVLDRRLATAGARGRRRGRIVGMGKIDTSRQNTNYVVSGRHTHYKVRVKRERLAAEVARRAERNRELRRHVVRAEAVHAKRLESAREHLSECQNRLRAAAAKEESRKHACSVLRTSVGIRLADTFEGILLDARFPTDRTFLQSWFSNCEAHAKTNEFAQKRCEERRREFRREAVSSTWLGMFVTGPTRYDFKRTQFSVRTNGTLGDAGVSADYEFRPDEQVEVYVTGRAVTNAKPVSGPKDGHSAFTKIPQMKAKQRTITFDVAPDVAESIRRAGGVAIFTVWKPEGEWTWRMDRNAIKGVTARVLGLQVRDLVTGRVLWSEPPSAYLTADEAAHMLKHQCIEQRSRLGADLPQADQPSDTLDKLLWRTATLLNVGNSFRLDAETLFQVGDHLSRYSGRVFEKKIHRLLGRVDESCASFEEVLRRLNGARR
jgi:hypothetical protein